uniref:NADH-ubiquinone oxidoreductase chain 3 n=1 Tax=Diximermis spiculatus TaxID=3313489 RepID=Q1HBB6_9BILA|nr:NADH dehydrogenase subunit 3 [Strelkovimermis spiculatus]ABF48165.1 NADH dehydrogenase subunit 3 [Strelkovimermis spiculatus]ABF48177.1 NADH dehydrogenase subunit 3 [Strelkovimermis spiculatus]
MWNLIQQIFVLLLIMLLVLVLFYILNFLLKINSNSMLSIYECGFDCVYWVHNKMNLHFFKMLLIFIIFDLELMLLVFSIKLFSHLIIILMIYMFIMFTMLMELNLLTLKWNN